MQAKASDESGGQPPDHTPASGPPPVHEAQPDHKRELIFRLIGRKISVSTTDMHHVVGRLVAIDGDDSLRILVNNQEVHVRRLGVARIHEADSALAEYVK